MLIKRLTVVALTALAVACGGDDRPLLKVGTEGTSFQRQLVPTTSVSPVAFVPYNTWNRGSATAFIPACGAHPTVTIERYAGGKWESYAGTFCIDVMIETPIELRAGASRTDSVAIGEAGHFRIRLPYGESASTGSRFVTLSRDFDVQ